MLRDIAGRIAATSNWDLSDYRHEISSAEGNLTSQSSFQSSSVDLSLEKRLIPNEPQLDNPCLTAIREALRHFCADDNHQQLRVGPVRSPAELEDLWAIDKAAYEDASITCERFHIEVLVVVAERPAIQMNMREPVFPL
jgi:hypothetical protein